jgi:hypothetical protein
MAARTLLAAGLVYLVPMLICATLLPQFATRHGSLSFILGAILASQFAAYRHWRASDAAPTLRSKLMLSALLASLTVAGGSLWQALLAPFVYPEIVIGIGALGTMFFPPLFVSQMWKHLAKLPRKSQKP